MDILSIGTSISTPMMLAGFFAAAFFLTIRIILKKNIFPSLTRSLSSQIIVIIINRLFWLAMIGMILGFAGFALGKFKPDPQQHKYSAAKPEMIKVIVESGWSVDFAPEPNKKNVGFRLKVIPKAAGYTPLHNKATLNIKLLNQIKSYSLDLDVDPEGVPPEIKSYLSASLMMSKNEFAKLIESNPPITAQIEVGYDPDVSLGRIKFISSEFEFSYRVIEEWTHH